MYLSSNLGKQGLFTVGLDLRKDLGFSFAVDDEIGFWLKEGTKVYAYAYYKGRLCKVQTSKNDLYHFLLVVLPRI